MDGCSNKHTVAVVVIRGRVNEGQSFVTHQPMWPSFVNRPWVEGGSLRDGMSRLLCGGGGLLLMGAWLSSAGCAERRACR